MKVFVLILLTLFLGVMVYLKFEMDEARKSSNEVETEFFTEEYTIKNLMTLGFTEKVRIAKGYL